MMKKLYDGSFNYNGQVFELFKCAFTANQAYFYMTRELAQKLKVTHSSIKYYFGGIKDNYEIREIIE